MSTCANCNSTIPDYSLCPYCEYARAQLLERLLEGDNHATELWVIAAEAGGFGEPVKKYQWTIR